MHNMIFPHRVAYYFSLFFGLVSPKYFYQLSGPLPHLLAFQSFRQLFPFFFDLLPFRWQFSHCSAIISTIQLVFLSLLYQLLRPLLLSQVFQPFSQFFAYFLHSLSLSWQIISIIFSVYLFSLFFQSIYSVTLFSKFIPLTFSILWVSYLTCFYQLLCLLPQLLVLQPFIYPISPLLPSFASPLLRILHIVGHIFSAIWLFSLKCLSQSLPAIQPILAVPQVQQAKELLESLKSLLLRHRKLPQIQKYYHIIPITRPQHIRGVDTGCF